MLHAEVTDMKARLASVTDQMEFERSAAQNIHAARTAAVLSSSALTLIFSTENGPNVQQKVEATDSLTGAFNVDVPKTTIPEGFSDAVARAARIATHPDRGGTTSAAQELGEALEQKATDEAFAVARALSIVNAQHAGSEDSATPEQLRNERYILSVALQNTSTLFTTRAQAAEATEQEVNGAEWRVRVTAAVKCLGLIVGSNTILTTFLQDVARENKPAIHDYLNTYLPQVLAVQERLLKGDPIALEQAKIESIDAILERIWSTLGNKTSSLPYSPPYHRWLDVILPAMQQLDPGIKPGVTYTQFDPIFKPTVRQPQTLRPFSTSSLYEEKNMSHNSFDYKHTKNSKEYYP
jgi:hypothetical protein